MNTKEKIAVMQAYIDDKSIEYWSHIYGNWRRLDGDSEPTWGWSNTEYRVKPEPRIIYVVNHVHNFESVYRTEKEALAACLHVGEVVKFMEILE